MSFALRPYLELCRIYLAPTAFADSLAGLALAIAWLRTTPSAVLLLVLPAVSGLLYSAGMVANDIFDVEKDRTLAPARPLPSGRASRTGAVVLSALLAAAAGILAALVGAWLPAVAVLALALAYTAGGKRLPLAGNLLMGGCRAGNFLLGAVAASSLDVLTVGPVVLGAGLLGLFIALVTAASVLEDDAEASRRALILPAGGALAIPVVLVLLEPGSAWNWGGAIILFGALARALARAWRAHGAVHPATVFVRGALGAIFLVDAGILWALAPSPREVAVPALGLYLLAIFAWWWKERWVQSGGPET